MPGFDGTGPRGMGPMTGWGRGFCRPRGIGAALGAEIAPPYPQAPHPFYRGYAPYGTPSAPQVTREQELDFLRREAQTMREQLEQIEARISGLTAEG